MRDAGLRQGPSFDDRSLGMAAPWRQTDLEEKKSILKSVVPTSAMMMMDLVQNKKPPTVPLRQLKSDKERNTQSYERDGFSAEEASNRAEADAAAQRQTGNPNARAAKDRFGNAVGDGKGGVVTSGELSGDKRNDHDYGKATTEQRAGFSAQGGRGSVLLILAQTKVNQLSAQKCIDKLS